ncbi:ABC transporter permease [Atopobacter phocae]|uniref:ABC transporter permease n=1 Tax=Atopobacter phocae TaxID=136492 RepID=UPI0004725EAF|nr:ABC transporter permease [Atopobacter phocae]
MDIIISSVSQGFFWSLMAIGVYMTFRLLDIADLSAEGSFPLGAAICAQLLVHGYSPIVATLASFIGGMLAGGVAGFLHTKMHIPSLLTGILVLTGLYSFNLRLMGRANIPLMTTPTLILKVQSLGISDEWAGFIVGLLMVILVISVLVWFLNTSFGLALRATGDNQMMSTANGINVKKMMVLAYMISNGLIALSGALLAQNNGYADISMGIGTIVIGLASVIIAEVLFHNLTIGQRFLTIVAGSIIYRLVIDFVMQQAFIPITPSDIKGLSAIALAIILWAPHATKAFQTNRNIKRNNR